MESLQVAMDWIWGLGIILLVPAAVWVAVILGLVSIVRDKVRKEETTLPEPNPDDLYEEIYKRRTRGMGSDIGFGEFMADNLRIFKRYAGRGFKKI